MSYGFFYLLIYFVMLSKFSQLSKIQILNINKLDNSFYKDLLNNLHFIDFLRQWHQNIANRLLLNSEIRFFNAPSNKSEFSFIDEVTKTVESESSALERTFLACRK